MDMSPVGQVWPKPSCRAKGNKTRKTEEEMGRQHQGMDRPGVRQVPEGSGEQGKMEDTGCEVICGAPTTLAAEGGEGKSLTWTTSSSTCAQMLMHAIAHGGVQTSKESTLKVDWDSHGGGGGT